MHLAVGPTTLKPLEEWVSIVSTMNSHVPADSMAKELNSLKNIRFPTHEVATQSFKMLQGRWICWLHAANMDDYCGLPIAVNTVIKRLIPIEDSPSSEECSTTSLSKNKELIDEIKKTKIILGSLLSAEVKVTDYELHELQVLHTKQYLDELTYLLSRRKGSSAPKPRPIPKDQESLLDSFYLDGAESHPSYPPTEGNSQVPMAKNVSLFYPTNLFHR